MEEAQEEWICCSECIFRNNCEIKAKLEKEYSSLSISPDCGCKDGISTVWLAQMLSNDDHAVQLKET